MKVQKLQWANKFLPLLLVAGIVMLFSSILGTIFFVQGKGIMENQLKARLKNIAVTAATAFRDVDLNQIQGPDDITQPVYADAIMLLNIIRAENVGLKFAYIFRPTKDPNTFEFVADADSLHPYDVYDFNGDGAINDSDALAPPGTTYDISRLPNLREALEVPTTTDKPYTDQWGTYMSGFAPIRNRHGKFLGVLGVDMDISDYNIVSQSIFSPVIFLLVLLTGTTIGGFVAFTIWKRRVESAATLNSERAGLLKMTFHELGEPLTVLNFSIDSLVEKTQGHAIGKKIDEEVAALRSATQSIDSILTSLASADKVQSGKIPYAPESLLLEKIIGKAYHDVHDLYARKRQTLVLGSIANVMVAVDPAIIGGVLRELLGNASSFSDRDATVHLDSALEGKFVRISVVDTGCGIPQQDLPRLFQEFTRASNAAHMKPDGTGLGLYIAKGVIEKAGGTINLTSEEGKGTTVSFTVPVA